jgi:uncharacterized protein (DUF983 family)
MSSRRSSPGAESARPSFWRMARRGLVRRCPRCGGKGAWFRGWFRRDDRCHTCGYRYERQDGFVLGAMTMNVIVTFGLIGLVLVLGVVLTFPDIAVVPILAGCVVIGVVTPVAIFPITYTLWAAVDLAMRPLEPAEEADALTWVAAHDR